MQLINKETNVHVSQKQSLAEKQLIASPFISIVEQFCQVSSNAKIQINLLTQTATLKKEKLLVSGEPNCSKLYVIKSGILRGFINIDGKEVTNWIACENEMVMCNIIRLQHPTMESVQALTNCELYYLNFEDFEYLYNQCPELNPVGRKLLEAYYRKINEENYIFKVQNARLKYEHFKQYHGNLIGRISKTVIASYLGLTKETLSRIRKS